jgi:hypothetical protein
MNLKVIATLLILAGLCGCANLPKEKSGLEGKPLPSFSLFLADSITHFNTSAIPSGQPIVLFYFGPYCPYSRAQMDDIIAHIKTLNSIRFYILTTSPFSEMKTFYTDYQLQKYPNIVVGVDYTSYFGDYFNAPGVPCLAIYDRQKRLKEILHGKSDISTIKEIAFE